MITLQNIARRYFSAAPSIPLFQVDKKAPPETYDTVYVDMDGTLILWTYFIINPALWDFLTVSKQRGKRIVLITRSDNPKAYLGLFGQELDFFDEVIKHVKDNKANHMQANSIFIDDKPYERESVQSVLDIPVIDPNTQIFRRIASYPNEDIANQAFLALC